MESGDQVLALNCGSSSVKLALLDPVSGVRSVEGLAERLGTPETTIRLSRGGERVELSAPDESTHRAVVAAMIQGLTESERESVVVVGHRIVHGGSRFTQSVRIDDDVLQGLVDVTDLAPLHTPGNIAGVLAARAALPGVPDVAVFDTAFHRTLPPHAFHYAVPQSWFEEHGVRRFGFHGISHQYVAMRAAELLGRHLDELHMVTVHLGNGCSACAVRGGASVDTTMGLTPLEGLVMGTRSGDIDAGALAYIGRRLGLDLDGVVAELTNSSGLLGISGISQDMRALVTAAQAGSASAALAVDVFCYRAAKAVSAMATALDRVDAVVLTGGIGEHSTEVRSAIMGHLAFLGVVEDPAANARNGADSAGRISAPGSTTVLVVPTDEELLIARDASALII